jgi:hypothetical protein
VKLVLDSARSILRIFASISSILAEFNSVP